VRHRLGEALGITADQLAVALAEHERTGERLGAVLVRLHLASETEIATILASQLGFRYVDLGATPPDPHAVVLIPSDLCIENECVAIHVDADVLTVAMTDPLMFGLLQELEGVTGFRIEPVVATRTDILSVLGNTSTVAAAPDRSGAERSPETFPPGRQPVERSVDDFVRLVMSEALASGAIEIHLQPAEAGVLVRHRLDGVIRLVQTLPASAQEGLTRRLKALAGLDQAETRLPQEGRLRVPGIDADFRLTTLRTTSGERIVLRLLAESARKTPPALEELGLSTTAFAALTTILREPHGLILLIGPSGSGKTTTACAAIAVMDARHRTIVTIEDPIEYQLPDGVARIEVGQAAGLTFAQGMRGALDQKADVILVGDLRDDETVRLVVEAAGSRHLVLAALRAEDAATAVARLHSVVTDAALAAALIGVVNQRLVRRLCGNCRRLAQPAIPFEEGGLSERSYRAEGCDQCSYTGYRGRIGLFEVTRAVPAFGTAESPVDVRRQDLTMSGAATIDEEALFKIAEGMTSVAEVRRVLGEPRAARSLCPGCGGPLGEGFVTCPHCQRRLTRDCPRCRRPLAADWAVCPFCGAPPQARTAGEPEAKPDRIGNMGK
jgi:type IV pilus assembly protein PilB